MTEVGTGQYRYQVIENWGNLPSSITLGNVGAVAVDSRDRVYVFQRGEPAILVFDSEGNFLTSWDDDNVNMGHGIYIGPDDVLYMTNSRKHLALKYTLDGQPLMVLGTKGQASDSGCTVPGRRVLQAVGPFNRPTQMVRSPSGDLYVSDGYCHCRVHRFSPDGKLISSWGKPGGYLPGELYVPHCVWVDREGLVYVCDRDNSRVQVFSAEGEFISEWTDMFRPMSIYMDANETVYVTESQGFIRELSWADKSQTIGQISIWDKQGNNLVRWDTPVTHWIFGDSRGDLYAAEVIPSIKKYVRLS